MNKESLEIVKDLFIETLENANIDNADKLELLLNIWLFLDDYKNNIEILSEYIKKRKK